VMSKLQTIVSGMVPSSLLLGCLQSRVWSVCMFLGYVSSAKGHV